MISAITRKTLKLSNNARKKFTIGQITNLVSVDAQRVMETFPYTAFLWAAPYQVCLYYDILIFFKNNMHVSILGYRWNDICL